MTADGIEPVPAPAAPTASTMRFALLIGAVLAAGTAIFIAIHGYLPARGESLTDRVARCGAVLRNEPAFTDPSPDQRGPLLAATARYRACVRPALGEIAVVVVVGHGVLFGLAGLSYLAHPWWLVRRRRLRPVSATGALSSYLDGMTPSRSPEWLIAPYQRTAGGQAFGTPWRRRIQLDAGLVVRFGTDRPAFRAVVLHELAHLRNRDVDKTYLTIGIWRAFLVAAVLPLAVLMVHPTLLWTPADWDGSALHDPGMAAYRAAGLLVLALLVYLTRNAVLRVRENEADALAAAQDGADSALPAVLERLPSQRHWWSKWGTHPDPARRLDVVRDPRLLLADNVWGLVGAGAAVGLLVANLTLMLGLVAGFDATLGLAMVGLVAGAALAAVLAASIWRATAAASDRRPSIRTWLPYPAAIVAGFLAGRFLELGNVPSLLSEPTLPNWRSWILTSLVLLAGAVLLAAWLASAARAILATPQRRRWAMPAVVIAAVVVGATFFATWLPNSFTAGVFWSEPPAPGGEIGWYAALVALTGWEVQGAAFLVYLPLTQPSLALLWLVPVLAGLRRTGAFSDRVPVRRAVIPGLIAGAGAVLLGAAVPFLAKATLPAHVRRLPEPDAAGVSFPLAQGRVLIAIGILAVVIVLAVVVARRGPHRPALAVLAATLTAMLAAAGVAHVALPVQCYANVMDLDPAPAQCLEPLDVGYLAELVNTMLVQGMILAVPVVLVAGFFGYRRSPSAVALAGRGFPATVAAIAVLVVVIGWLIWGILPASGTLWLEPTFG